MQEQEYGKGRLALITQDRGLEKVLERLSKYLGSELQVHESCTGFVQGLRDSEQGVVVVDASVCSQARLMDLQIILNSASSWQVIYLPKSNKKTEIMEAMSIGTFGCLHQPLNEKEVRQMVQSAMGI